MREDRVLDVEELYKRQADWMRIIKGMLGAFLRQKNCENSTQSFPNTNSWASSNAKSEVEAGKIVVSHNAS